MEELQIVNEIKIKTPFGNPSDKILIGKFPESGLIAFLPRHGRGHYILPTEVNSRANIWALKSLGVEAIIAVSAVGSLKEEIRPGDIAVPDQIIDRTRLRVNTFFGEGFVGHVPFAEPFCRDLRQLIIEEIKKLNFAYHDKGIYICMEGPAFSTKAESHLYRSWGASYIGMTALPEAKLAREAEICYALIALATDYDCWREKEESVSADMVSKTMHDNVKKAKAILKELVHKLPVKNNTCGCNTAVEYAVMTDKKCIPDKVKKKLDLFYRKYFNK